MGAKQMVTGLDGKKTYIALGAVALILILQQTGVIGGVEDVKPAWDFVQDILVVGAGAALRHGIPKKV